MTRKTKTTPTTTPKARQPAANGAARDSDGYVAPTLSTAPHKGLRTERVGAPGHQVLLYTSDHRALPFRMRAGGVAVMPKMREALGGRADEAPMFAGATYIRCTTMGELGMAVGALASMTDLPGRSADYVRPAQEKLVQVGAYHAAQAEQAEPAPKARKARKAARAPAAEPTIDQVAAELAAEGVPSSHAAPAPAPRKVRPAPKARKARTTTEQAPAAGEVA